MAQLPPKVPNFALTPDWPTFAFPHHHDGDFHHFSSGRRGTHRRSVSDSVTFLESPSATATPDPCLDDDQLMFMFSADAPPEASPSASDQNSNNEDEMTVPPSCRLQPLKHEAMGEVESSWETDLRDSTAGFGGGGGGDHLIADPKRVKR